VRSIADSVSQWWFEKKLSGSLRGNVATGSWLRCNLSEAGFWRVSEALKPSGRSSISEEAGSCDYLPRFSSWRQAQGALSTVAAGGGERVGACECAVSEATEGQEAEYSTYEEE